MNLKRHKLAVIALLAVLFAAAACVFEISEVIFPENATTGQDIEIIAKIKMEPTTDDKNTNFVFAVLAPKSWDLKNTASLTFSTEGYTVHGGSEFTDAEMIVIPDNETEKSTGGTYPMAYQKKIGTMGNYGSVEWTVFRSVDKLSIDDKLSTEAVKATIKIKCRTGAEGVKFNMGFGFCGTNWGLTPEGDATEGRYTPHEKAFPFTVKDADGNYDDFTTRKVAGTTPSQFRYGDIFAVEFSAEGTPFDPDYQPLTKADESESEKVYLCATAVLQDGTTKTVEQIDEAHVMEQVDDLNYSKYIYPNHFFGLGENEVIEELYVYFVNADKSKIAAKDPEDPESLGYLLKQAKE